MTGKRTRSLEMAVHQRDSCGSLWLQQQQPPTLQMEVMGHGPVSMAGLGDMNSHLQAMQNLSGMQTLPHSMGHQISGMAQMSNQSGGLVSHVCTGGSHSQQGTPSHHVHAHVHQSNGELTKLLNFVTSKTVLCYIC